MIIFEKISMRNFFSVGNTPIEIDLNTHRKTLVIGKNGASKCVDINTLVKVRDKKTNEIYEITIGELYESQKKQNSSREN